MNLHEQDITSNDVTLHVYRTRSDKPPLIFAHGRSDNGLCYWPTAAEFAADYEIILYDARDHGLSTKLAAPTKLLDRAHDLAGLVEALGLVKPTLVGHSLGAVTVSLLAGLYPDLPGRIVLEDPPPFALMAGDSEQARSRHQGWEQWIGAIKGKSQAELVEMNQQDSPDWPEAERAPWAQSKLQYAVKPFGDDRIDPAEGEEIIARISCPTLLVTADLDRGAIYPPDLADKWVAGLPNARHVNIAGAGHNIRREQPAAFLAAVRAFLADC